ncbi:exodeoxyribonuclease VII large subunit [Thalassotalea ganghwensis]
MSQQHILQVSELTQKVKFMLESELRTVWLTGEISNFVPASSGHWYLSLKDSKSQVRCAMFKGSNQRVRLSPANGQQVLVRAKVSLYEPRGDFQLIIETMEPAGDGLLRQQFEQLKAKLNALGLFSPVHKKALPKAINCVGIITSPTGAAVKDIITVLKRRNPSVEVVIYPSLVQGDLAANDISLAIESANKHHYCDVLIVGRGGGSLEDLWCFNEETVVNAIYHSVIPIISAVGHEIDTTLSDYVADLRAPTPSAAAELVSTDANELLTQLSNRTKHLHFLAQGYLSRSSVRFSQVKHRLMQVHPKARLQQQQQKTDELANRLEQAMYRYVKALRLMPSGLATRLTSHNPEKMLIRNQERYLQIQKRFYNAIERQIKSKQQKFGHLIEQLHVVSPLATIARGYSVTRNENEKIIRSINDTNEHEQIKIQVRDGYIIGEVIAKQKHTKA